LFKRADTSTIKSASVNLAFMSAPFYPCCTVTNSALTLPRRTYAI
jgi:hypothetical protein